MDSLVDNPPLDLTGAWSFAYSPTPLDSEPTTAAELAAALELRPCTVPGNFELDLQAAGLLPDPFLGMNMTEVHELEGTHVWYTRRFRAEVRPGQEAQLVFEGLDCFAEVYLNGRHLGSTDNMLVEHVFAVDEYLQGDNELLVHIRPAVEEAKRFDYPANVAAMSFNYESLYVRKAPHMYGWDIMPRAVSAGIWRPVTLCYRPVERLEQVYLETLQIAPDRGWASLLFHYQAKTGRVGAQHAVPDRPDRAEKGAQHAVPGRPDRAGERAQHAVPLQVRVEGVCGESRFSQVQALLFDAGHVQFTVPSPRLWWPAGRGAADLYEVTATLVKDGAEIDRVSFTHGIRTVELERTSLTDQAGSGQFLFRVNGEPFFAKGSNWVPVDAFHSRDAERIPRIIEMAVDVGCNMLRCWGGNVYEDNLFYRLCDERGLLVWQDFAMACAVYPQDAEFQRRIAEQARAVVRRLRQHPCIALWSGDNECDYAYLWFGRTLDPNQNVLTRRVLPEVLRQEDPLRPYLPSSPYLDEAAFRAPVRTLPEDHPWGPRDYYKGAFYKNTLCHFASEIGYHGCPAPESLREFLSPDKVWPYQDNAEWLLHATSPVPGQEGYNYRVQLMANQIRELFGAVPDTLEDFAFASQVSQAEAKKFFVELFRGQKWRRTGILWWNLMDGWPQLSDAVVDYYFRKKLAYDFLKRAQQPLLLLLREPENWRQELVASNDTREDQALDYVVRDVETDAVLAEGQALARADRVTVLSSLPFSMGDKRFYTLEWQAGALSGKSHYLAGNPPFELERYRGWLTKAGLL